jgi:hypothetical protein
VQNPAKADHRQQPREGSSADVVHDKQVSPRALPARHLAASVPEATSAIAASRAVLKGPLHPCREDTTTCD